MADVGLEVVIVVDGGRTVCGVVSVILVVLGVITNVELEVGVDEGTEGVVVTTGIVVVTTIGVEVTGIEVTGVVGVDISTEVDGCNMRIYL